MYFMIESLRNNNREVPPSISIHAKSPCLLARDGCLLALTYPGFRQDLANADRIAPTTTSTADDNAR